jgi:hypothetical protein
MPGGRHPKRPHRCAAFPARLLPPLLPAETNAGEVEVRDALQAKAVYLCSISDHAAALEAYATAEGKTAGVGPKMDLCFSLIRWGLRCGALCGTALCMLWWPSGEDCARAAVCFGTAGAAGSLAAGPGWAAAPQPLGTTQAHAPLLPLLPLPLLQAGAEPRRLAGSQGGAGQG